jgi:hypothetical protein
MAGWKVAGRAGFFNLPTFQFSTFNIAVSGERGKRRS